MKGEHEREMEEMRCKLKDTIAGLEHRLIDAQEEIDFINDDLKDHQEFKRRIDIHWTLNRNLPSTSV